MIGCFIFATIVGFSPSVTRAMIMTLIYFSGKLLDKETDSLNSLGFSLLILLILNPYSILDVGLQLSFFSTWGIIVLAPVFNKISKLNKKIFVFFRNSFFISLAATCATVPIIIINFTEISIAAPLTNVFIAPIIPVSLFTALICGILKPLIFNTFIYRLIATFLNLIITLIISVADIFAKLATIKLNSNTIVFTVFIFIFTVLLPIVLIIKQHNTINIEKLK